VNVPFIAAIAALAKLEKIQSLHADMMVNMDMEALVSLAGFEQSIPLDMNIAMGMDLSKDPVKVRLDMNKITPDTEARDLFYAVQDGDDWVLYVSHDNGVTWQKETNPQNIRLPQLPDAAMDMLVNAISNVQKVGTDQVNGSPAAVYTGTINSRLLMKLLGSISFDGDLAKLLGDFPSDDMLSNLSDIELTIMIDEESGLPVRYTADMTDAVKDLLELAILKKTKVASLEAAGITLNVPSVVMDVTLSQFDSIDPIEIPQAALNEADPTPPAEGMGLENNAAPSGDYLTAQLKEIVDSEGDPCVLISFSLQPGDTLTFVLPNQEDHVIENTDDIVSPYEITVLKACFSPIVP
jgi:hypothetical protein